MFDPMNSIISAKVAKLDKKKYLRVKKRHATKMMLFNRNLELGGKPINLDDEDMVEDIKIPYQSHSDNSEKYETK